MNMGLTSRMPLKPIYENIMQGNNFITTHQWVIYVYIKKETIYILLCTWQMLHWREISSIVTLHSSKFQNMFQNSSNQYKYWYDYIKFSFVFEPFGAINVYNRSLILLREPLNYMFWIIRTIWYRIFF